MTDALLDLSSRLEKHPANGMTEPVHVGSGAFMTIINPQSYPNGGPEWVMRYGDPESIRYTAAALLESYDYLLCGEITMKEAVRRLRIMRGARKALLAQGQKQ